MFLKNEKVNVEFIADENYIDAFPHPAPAHKFLPSWYKRMEAFPYKNQAGTMKSCIPMRDAMTSGYIIPLWQDFYFEVNEEKKININFGVQEFSIEDHAYTQIQGSPYGDYEFGRVPMKFVSPWIIKTPPGWSVILTQPLNHGEDRFEIPTSIVDTDEYTNQINYPFIWKKDGFNDVLKAGTPFIQVIPFKRAEYVSNVRTASKRELLKKNSIGNSLKTVFHNAYTNKYWKQKKFR